MYKEIYWEKFSFRSHYIGKLMSKAKGKSKLEQYNECNLSIDKKLEQLNACSEKAIKTKEKLELELDNLHDKKEALELVKHLPHLSDTCKSKLADIYTTETSGRTQDIQSKYMEKGLLMEEDAITLYSQATGEMFRKNKLREDNGFVNGEKDFSNAEMVFDTKVNWDIFTFNRVVAKPIDPLYHWQLDNYMWLFNKSKARLVYALMNTPEHLVQAEVNKLMYQLFGCLVNEASIPDGYKDAFVELRDKHNYDDYPIEKRVRIFTVDRSEERIEAIKAAIPHWRNYLINFGKNTELQSEEEEEA